MRALLLFILLAFVSSTRAALSLAPTPSEYLGEGVKYTQLMFKDDKRQVTYVPPSLWAYRGSAAQLQLTPPENFKRATAAIEAAPLTAPQPLDEKTIQLVRQQFLSSLPFGSQDVKVLAEEQNSVLIDGKIETYEISVSYQVYGEAYVRSCLFANLPDFQLRFKLTASKKDFDTLHRAFRASIVSWQWTESQPEKTRVAVATAAVSAN